MKIMVMKKILTVIALAMLTVMPVTAQKMVLGKNEPIGTGRGIHPGRVVWTHAPGVANWNQQDGRWYEERWNNQQLADWLVSEALTALTGEKDGKRAWKALFTYFNIQHGKGKVGYKPSERIAIKLNMNNTDGYADGDPINASPYVTLALLRSIIRDGGVKASQIILFDASRFITDALYERCHKEFPEVHFVDNEGGNGREKSEYIDNAIHYSKDNGQLARGLAKCAVEADYLINTALLKGHVGQGVTLCGKNWYGMTSIHRDWRRNHHDNFDQDYSGKPKYMTFVDFMAHKHMGEKTMLFLIDGTYGSKVVDLAPSGPWQMPPFNGQWPSSLLLSQDGVAIDAVALDFLVSEYPDMADVNYSDMYLVEAALADNPPSGTFYSPSGDGKRARSLGMMEHWNNATDKHYKGIELIYRTTDKPLRSADYDTTRSHRCPAQCEGLQAPAIDRRECQIAGREDRGT